MRRPNMPPAFFADDNVLSRWTLFRPDRPRVFSGRHPLVVPLVQSGDFPEDMDALVLDVENLAGRPLSVGLTLTNDGDPPAVAATGGRETLKPRDPARVSFPLESFGGHGPTGGAKGKIRRIDLLVRREQDCPEPLRLEVAVTQLLGLRRIRPPGPRLTMEGLAHVLRNRPDQALGPRDLFPYSAENPLMGVPPPVFCYPGDRASQVLSGRIMGETAGFPPCGGTAPNGELEWRHFLHRHHFMRPLVRMLSRTADRRCLTALERAVTDWATRNPCPLDSDGGAGPGWETLSAAFRVREWLWLMGAAWNRPDSSREVKCIMLRSLWEHARHLADYRGHPGNWRLLEAASLSLIGILFPEFTESAAWREKGLERLEKEASLQFFEDGLHFEISPMYHGLCVQACLEVFEAGRRAGFGIPAVISDGLPKWFRALAALYRPDFTRPSINDSGGFREHERPLLRYAGAALQLPDVLWTGSRGHCGHPPTETSSFFPEAGLAVMNSARPGRGLWVLFRAGPPGAAHIHEDSLSLELSVSGRPVLVDPGISRYSPSPLTLSYRQAGSHSTILAGNSHPPARTLPFQERIRSAKDRFTHMRRPGLEVVTGTRGAGFPTFTRSVALVAERFVVVRDSIAGTGKVDVRVHWQFAPGLNIRAGKTGAYGVVLSEEKSIARFVFPAASGNCRVERVEGRLDPPGGFVALRGHDVPALRLEYIFALQAPASLHWIFLAPDEGDLWEIAESGPDLMKFSPSTGRGFTLDTVAWEIKDGPDRDTSG